LPCRVVAVSDSPFAIGEVLYFTVYRPVDVADGIYYIGGHVADSIVGVIVYRLVVQPVGPGFDGDFIGNIIQFIIAQPAAAGGVIIFQAVHVYAGTPIAGKRIDIAVAVVSEGLGVPAGRGGRAIRSYACRPYAQGRYTLLSLTHFSFYAISKNGFE